MNCVFVQGPMANVAREPLAAWTCCNSSSADTGAIDGSRLSGKARAASVVVARGVAAVSTSCGLTAASALFEHYLKCASLSRLG
jgi:hypothetical protein